MTSSERHIQIAQQLGARIARGELRPGDHLPPEPELARQLGVSRFTLRKALDSLAGDGKVVRQRGLGTRIADSRSGSGTLVSYLGETDSHVYAELFLALTRASQAAGMLIQVLEPDRLGTYQPIVRRDGKDLANHLVCAGWPATRAAQLPTSPAALRVVTGLRHGEVAGFDYAVIADHGHAFLQAVGHLAQAGHRRIALAMSPCTDAGMPITELCRIAMIHHGLPDARVLATSGAEADWSRQIADQLGRAERPSAIVCEMDYMGVHVYDAAKQLGLDIPRDLSVIGMYDTPWSRVLRPQLATVSFPIDLIARMTIACLSAGRPAAPRRIGVQGELVERSSCARPL